MLYKEIFLFIGKIVTDYFLVECKQPSTNPKELIGAAARTEYAGTAVKNVVRCCVIGRHIYLSQSTLALQISFHS
jgi:hypothetical protein